MIERIHPEIKEFIGNLGPENIRTHVLGHVTGISSKDPPLVLLFQEKSDEIICFVRFLGVRYTEEEFLKLLSLKSFW